MKYSRKINPSFSFDFYAYEAWLEDLAQEGFFLVSFGGQRSKFRQDTPQKMKYRIEIPKYFDTAPPRAVQEERSQQGWTFVAPYFQIGFLWCSAEENAVEFIDSTVQTEHIHVLYKHTGIFYLFGVVLLLLLLTAKEVLHHLTLPFSFDRFLSVWLLMLLIWEGYSLYLLKTMKKELLTTDFINHRRDYRKSMRLQKINILFSFLLILTWMLALFLPFLLF